MIQKKRMADMVVQNVKGSPMLMGITITIIAAAFSGMVTSAYIADHIKKADCDISEDGNLKSAYTWAWSSALLSGLVATGLTGIVIWTSIKKGE